MERPWSSRHPTIATAAVMLAGTLIAILFALGYFVAPPPSLAEIVLVPLVVSQEMTFPPPGKRAELDAHADHRQHLRRE